ncbi:hypothetical protein CVT26_012491 [Gymnopilus dilepis]|uniref:DUF6534 domain-containing protein n=1 Tax=Gymnopilus dilepis TaxID=231916 RepID=A0A409YCX2_9AGAR|nr:hypothetical protein CVT26_012491 [Gymnopilus dilepis]
MSSLVFSQSAGALLIGGLFASLLSGFVMAQTYMYYKTYPLDMKYLKALVLVICILDTCHTAFIWTALWSYLIDNYGEPGAIDIIHWCVCLPMFISRLTGHISRNIALTIVVTAIVTFLVQLFFSYRIFMLSKKNYFIAAPIVIMALLRLVSACVSTAEMYVFVQLQTAQRLREINARFHLGTFTQFRALVQWVFTSGLSLSTAADFLITGSLFILLHNSRTGAPNVNALIDGLIMYAFETGLLTSAGTVVSMICWLAMPRNIVFLGLHFVIGKSYAISLLVTSVFQIKRQCQLMEETFRLNMRENFRRGHSSAPKEFGAPVIFDARRRRTADPDQLALSVIETDGKRGSAELNLKHTMLEVNVERTVHYDL